MRSFAERVIAVEDGGNNRSKPGGPVSFPTSQKLRLQLVTLMGSAGFHALLSRALALATAEVAWLRAVQVTKEGVWTGLELLQAKLEPEELYEGRVVLLAQLLGLLEAFIGERLTVRLVREVWPKIELNDLDLGEGDQNEKTK